MDYLKRFWLRIHNPWAALGTLGATLVKRCAPVQNQHKKMPRQLSFRDAIAPLAENGQRKSHDKANRNVPDAKRSADKDQNPVAATCRECTCSRCELGAGTNSTTPSTAAGNS